MASGYFPNTAPDVGSLLAQKYRVLRRIGEGGMGVVVEAENTLTGKRVAIKWMHPQVAARPDALERFMREARASARVRHPNVVDVYDVVQDPSGVFLVMELLEGEPLSMLLDRGGVPAYEVIGLLVEAMRGVAAAHRQGIVHRDIKPDNIFLAREPDRPIRTPKVLDFGISKLNDANERLTLTATGATLGTPLYMSYEQLAGAKDVDARSDIYAFGVILYEALAGQPPYVAHSFPELIVKLVNQPPTPLREVRPDIPVALESLVASAMARERERRPASLEALIRALEPYATKNSFRALVTAERAAIARHPSPNPSLLVEARPSFPIGTPLQAEVPIPRVPRKHGAAPWVFALVAVGGAMAALSWWRGGMAAPDSPIAGPPPAALEPESARASQLSAAGQAAPQAASAPQLRSAPSQPAAQGPAQVEAGARRSLQAPARPQGSTVPSAVHPNPKPETTLMAAPARSVAPRVPSAEDSPPVAAPAFPVQPAAPGTGTQTEREFRAGRARSQDF